MLSIDIYIMVACSFLFLYVIGIALSRWGISRSWFAHTMQAKWVNRLHWVVKLQILMLWFAPSVDQTLLSAGILLCCLPVILRWTTAEYQPSVDPLRPVQG